MLQLSLIALATVGAVACDESLSDVAGPSPNLEPTFSSIQHEIFEARDASGRAACTECHTDAGRTPSGGLNLRHDVAYTSLVNMASRGKTGATRVVPSNPADSYLLDKVEGAPGMVGERMPRTGGPYLTPGQILIMRRWIELGAKND
jgi:hypothetical protein